MNTPITLDPQALKTLIKDSIREVLQEEWFTIWQSVMPTVSDAEQANLEKLIGTPKDYENSKFVDMTDCLS